MLHLQGIENNFETSVLFLLYTLLNKPTFPFFFLQYIYKKKFINFSHRIILEMFYFRSQYSPRNCASHEIKGINKKIP